MPLASDARPRVGGDRGKGALRWTAPMVNTARPSVADGRRHRETSRTTTGGPASRDASGSSSSGPRRAARASDAAARVAADEAFDEDFAALAVQYAEEVERELSPPSARPAPSSAASAGPSDAAPSGASARPDDAGVPDPSPFRRASQTAIGSFIERFRGAAPREASDSPPAADSPSADAREPRRWRPASSPLSDGWTSAADSPGGFSPARLHRRPPRARARSGPQPRRRALGTIHRGRRRRRRRVGAMGRRRRHHRRRRRRRKRRARIGGDAARGRAAAARGAGALPTGVAGKRGRYPRAVAQKAENGGC